MAVHESARGPGEEPVLVPDDARALEHDVRALERERRSARRRSTARRLLLSRPSRLGVPGLLVVLVLACVAGVGSLVVLLHPQFGDRPLPRPLAQPPVPAGQVGGLLPEGPVLTPAGRTTTRALPRPGTLVLVPTPCSCGPAAAWVVDQALQVSRNVRLISDGSQDPSGTAAAALRTGATRGLATSGVDERGVLATYAGPAAQRDPAAVTAVLVGGDGVVVAVVRDVRQGRRLDAEVGRLQSHERATGG